MSQWKLGTNVSKLREEAGERYKFISRFLFICKILAILSVIGWLIFLEAVIPRPEEGLPVLITMIIYTWCVLSVLKFVKPLVDIAVSSKMNEELLKENTDYLRQLVEIEKFKLRRSGQMPSE